MDDHDDEDFENGRDDDNVWYLEEPWREAVTSGDVEELQDLIEELGLVVLLENAVDEEWNTMATPLLVAVQLQHMEMVRYLVEACSAAVDINESGHDSYETRGFTALHYATQADNLDLVLYLVQQGCDVNNVDEEDKTALHIAVEMEHVDIAKHLIDTGLCDLDAATAKRQHMGAATALSLAVYCADNLEIVQYLMKGSSWADEEKADRATRVLPGACYQRNLEMVQYLVESHRADVNAIALDDVLVNGRTPLCVACRRGSLELVHYLVEQCRANVGACSDIGRSPLHFACKSGQLDVVQYLVEKCAANTKATAKCESTLLHAASASDKSDVVQYLVEKCGVDVESTAKNGDTALHEAARRGRLETVQYLLENGRANVEAKNSNQKSALHLACSRHDDANATAIARYLVDARNINVALPDSQGETALHVACRPRNVEVVQCLIETGRINVNAVDMKGRTAMHRCFHYDIGLRSDAEANTKCLQIAEILANTGQVNFEARDKDGRTVLYLASEKAMLKLVLFLLQDCHVDVNAADSSLKTALHIAVQRGHFEMVQELVNWPHTNVNAVDKNGCTALHISCGATSVEDPMSIHRRPWDENRDESGRIRIIQYLLKSSRVNVEAQDNQGKTALHRSFVNPYTIAPFDLKDRKYVRDTSFTIVQLLVESGRVNVDATDRMGQTALHYYCSLRNFDIPHYLIEQAHASVDVIDVEGKTDLHRAASSVTSPRGNGMRLLLFLVSRLSADPFGRDDDEEAQPVPCTLAENGGGGRCDRQERLPKRQKTWRHAYVAWNRHFLLKGKPTAHPSDCTTSFSNREGSLSSGKIGWALNEETMVEGRGRLAGARQFYRWQRSACHLYSYQVRAAHVGSLRHGCSARRCPQPPCYRLHLDESMPMTTVKDNARCFWTANTARWIPSLGLVGIGHA